MHRRCRNFRAPAKVTHSAVPALQASLGTRARGRRSLFDMMKAGIALVSFLAAVGAAPLAHAARVCSNTLSDGRIIVQGPLVDSFGAPCSRAVLLPTRHASRGEVTIIDSA